jgi:hypothetical protein
MKVPVYTPVPLPDALSLENGRSHLPRHRPRVWCCGRGAGGTNLGNDLLRELSQVTLEVSPDLLRRQITLVGSISTSASRSGDRSVALRRLEDEGIAAKKRALEEVTSAA